MFGGIIKILSRFRKQLIMIFADVIMQVLALWKKIKVIFYHNRRSFFQEINMYE